MSTESFLSFPSKVFKGAGVLCHLPSVIQSYGDKAFILGGRRALAVVLPQTDSLMSGNERLSVVTAWYGGEATVENIHRLKQQAIESQADVIIAVGGGKHWIPARLWLKKPAYPL